MSVTIRLACDSCGTVAYGDQPLHKAFFGVTGKPGGFGSWRFTNDAESVVPVGWIAWDPYTACCYCAKCWVEITVMSESRADIALAAVGEGKP